MSLTGDLRAGDIGATLTFTVPFDLAGCTAITLLVKPPTFGAAAYAVPVVGTLPTEGSTVPYITTGSDFPIPGTYRVTVQVAFDGTPALNLIENGDFETSINFAVAQNGATLSRSNAQAHTGSYSLEVIAPVATAGVKITNGQNLSVTGGALYTFIAWVYGAPSDPIFLNVTFYDADNNALTQAAQTFTLETEFQECLVQGVAPADAVSAALFIESVDVNGAITFWADTLCFGLAPLQSAPQAFIVADPVAT